MILRDLGHAATVDAESMLNTIYDHIIAGDVRLAAKDPEIM